MDKLINVMIVDDEQEAIDYLTILLKENFPELNICATAGSSKEALEKIFRKHPDLIFLDIKIDEKNGFDILFELEKENHLPYIVFVTAFNKYAVDAFKVNALDYLLKPVDIVELRRTIEKFKDLREKENQDTQIQNIANLFPQKIKFNTRTGFIFLSTNDILYCEADRNYTKIFTSPEKYDLVSLNLASVVQKLPSGKFWRISRSHLVNSDFVTVVDRKNKTCILKIQNIGITLSTSDKMLKKLF